MPFAEYAAYDGLGLAELVRRGAVTPAELVDAAIARIERHNPKLNAVIYKMYDRARAAAARPPEGAPGAFYGVPFLLKDILGNYAGVPTTAGCRFMTGVPATRDDTLVVRFKAAGLNVLGKTNAPECGILPTTESALYGPCRNPWNLEYSTGGSSGGSAAAVAAGIVPLAHANDGGGSIRIPAACRGLVGLKPTRARNPAGPDIGDLFGGLAVEHVVSRTVRDTAAALDCTHGPEPGDPYCAPPVARPFLHRERVPAPGARADRGSEVRAVDQSRNVAEAVAPPLSFVLPSTRSAFPMRSPKRRTESQSASLRGARRSSPMRWRCSIGPLEVTKTPTDSLAA